MSSSLRKLAVMGASLLFMVLLFLVAEGAVRLLGLEPREWPAAGGDRTPPEIKVDPLLGPLPRPGWSGRWAAQFETAIDARGFRTTALPPPTAPRRAVAFVGDSCTFGWGLDSEQTFVAALDARQRQSGESSTALLNAAYPGQSAVVGEHMLVERVLPLRPDVVVIGYGANNAFRFSLVADRDRFRNFGVRRWVFRSRLLHLIAAALVGRQTAPPDPRQRAAIDALPIAQLQRVAAPQEFVQSERQMVRAARAAGAAPLLLIFPRASSVSTDFSTEDAARARDALLAQGDAGAAASRDRLRDRGLLEFSCVDPQGLADPLAAVRERAGDWHPVYPDRADVRRLLRAGAQAYVAGRWDEALRQFAAGVAAQPDSPLAHYDLGLAQIAAGDAAAGLRALEEADRLACSIFLHYQVLTWQVALAEHVPAVDLTPWFQTHDGESLFLDPAHPNAIGAQLVADALWPAIQAAAAQSALRE